MGTGQGRNKMATLMTAIALFSLAGMALDHVLVARRVVAR